MYHIITIFTLKVYQDRYSIIKVLFCVYSHPINIAVLLMRERGDLLKLEQKWWVSKGECAGVDGGVSVVYLFKLLYFITIFSLGPSYTSAVIKINFKKFRLCEIVFC